MPVQSSVLAIFKEQGVPPKLEVRTCDFHAAGGPMGAGGRGAIRDRRVRLVFLMLVRAVLSWPATVFPGQSLNGALGNLAGLQ